MIILLALGDSWLVMVVLVVVVVLVDVVLVVVVDVGVGDHCGETQPPRQQQCASIRLF